MTKYKMMQFRCNEMCVNENYENGGIGAICVCIKTMYYDWRFDYCTWHG